MSAALTKLLTLFEDIAATKDLESDSMSYIIQHHLRKAQINSSRFAGFLYGTIPHVVVQISSSQILDYHATIWLKWHLPEEKLPHGLVQLNDYPEFYARFRRIPSFLLHDHYIKLLSSRDKEMSYEARYRALSHAYRERIERNKRNRQNNPKNSST